MQLKFFNWEAQDSDRIKENGSEQDRIGPWPHSASSIFSIQRKKVIKSDNGGPTSGNGAGTGETLLLIQPWSNSWRATLVICDCDKQTKGFPCTDQLWPQVEKLCS